MKGGDRPSLYASDKDTVGIVLVMFDEIAWSLFGWNSNQGYTLVSWLEPDNLWFVLLTILLVASRGTIAMLTLSLLLLFSCLTART